MIYNYTKCESVIAKIMADFDSSEVQNRVTDIREWIFEAVDKIGAPMQYIDNEYRRQIQDHQIPLPVDLHSIDAVAYSKNENGPWVVMLPMTSSFKKIAHEKPQHLPSPVKLTSQSQIYTINNIKYVERMFANKEIERPEYFIKPGWIVTNKHDGYIKIAYKSTAVDERGYPLIPDSTAYQEAVYWYVMMKLNFSKMLNGRLGGRRGVNTPYNIYSYMQQQWNFYRNQAYAEAMMPTEGDMKNIKHDWHKLIPDYDADDNFFQDINKEQQFYNDYYYGY